MERLIVDIPEARETLAQTPLDGFNEAVQSVVRDIEKARKAGRRDTCFCPSCFKGDYYYSVKAEFKRHGYTFRPTGFIGGVWQYTEHICW